VAPFAGAALPDPDLNGLGRSADEPVDLDMKQMPAFNPGKTEPDLGYH
jgi:hypothetical protein